MIINCIYWILLCRFSKFVYFYLIFRNLCCDEFNGGGSGVGESWFIFVILYIYYNNGIVCCFVNYKFYSRNGLFYNDCEYYGGFIYIYYVILFYCGGFNGWWILC